jgi:hypothetical protein
MIWAASNITQGSLEGYAHLYYLFTLQIFFVAIRKGDILHLPARPWGNQSGSLSCENPLAERVSPTSNGGFPSPSKHSSQQA